MPDVKQYRQTATVYAEQLDGPYAAYGSRGLVQGANGDYLCYREGAEQDKYVLERLIFEDTHEEIPPQETPQEPTGPDAGISLSPASESASTQTTDQAVQQEATAGASADDNQPLKDAAQAGTEPPPEPFVTQETPGLGAAGEVAPDADTSPSGPRVTEGAQTTATTGTASDANTTP